MPELLAPAGNFEKLKVALHYGADAVYVGLDKLSLRANADNFTREELSDAIDYTHSFGKKIYIALNIYFTPEQSERIIDALRFLASAKPDGIIVSDVGTMYLAREIAPNISIHISTQANCTNQYAAKQFQAFGAKRIVLARELTLEQIKQIKLSVPDLELEVFIHGAMCIAYSGRCILSSYMTTKGLGAREQEKDCEIRSANKGDCSHSCRWEFTLKEKTREKEEFSISEDGNGTYILSSKDICMIDHMKTLMDTGVSSFKIEGRMKSILYLSSIVRAYRWVIDQVAAGDGKPEMGDIYRELDVVSHREFSTGFFFSSPQQGGNLTEQIAYQRNVRLAALILNDGIYPDIKLYNKITQHDRLELIGKGRKTIPIGKVEFFDCQDRQIEEVKHTEQVKMKLYDLNGKPIEMEALDILRMESNF